MAVGRAKERLSQESFVDAAIRIAARREPDGLTSRALGVELGVDRTAVWRHFENKDALLKAVGDRLLHMAIDSVDPAEEPRVLLRNLAHAVVTVFVHHPYVARELSFRGTSGPGEFAAMELMLSALDGLGVPKPAAALLQRTMADTVLALASARASFSLLPEDVQDENALWVNNYRAVNPARYPAIAAHADDLAKVEDPDIVDCLVTSYLTAIDGSATDR